MDLNTHRKTQKQHHCFPARQRATSQNFSEGERREKHLITSNPCEPFWSPKVLGCPRPCVCSVSGNDLPLHERSSARQPGCLPWSGAAPFLVNSSFPGLPLACWLAGARAARAQGCRGRHSLLGGQPEPAPFAKRLLQGGQLTALWLLGESLLKGRAKAIVIKAHTAGC